MEVSVVTTPTFENPTNFECLILANNSIKSSGYLVFLQPILHFF